MLPDKKYLFETQISADQTQIVASTNHRFLYKDLSYQIIGCFYAIYNELGPEHKENIYHESLKIIFDEKKLNFRSKPAIPIYFREKRVGIYEPDFLIDDKIVIEIKSLQNMSKAFETQLYYYIRGTHYKVGYLVNFGDNVIDIRRKIFDVVRKTPMRQSV